MNYQVYRVGSEIIVEIPELNIKANFNDMDDVTAFIQSMIKNVKSF